MISHAQSIQFKNTKHLQFILNLQMDEIAYEDQDQTEQKVQSDL